MVGCVVIDLMTVDEVGEILRISRDGVYRRISAGEIQTVNVGSAKRPRMRITHAALEDYLNKRTSDRPARSAS